MTTQINTDAELEAWFAQQPRVVLVSHTWVAGGEEEYVWHIRPEKLGQPVRYIGYRGPAREERTHGKA